MDRSLIADIVALCLVQVCLSILCYRIWQLKERWRKLYHEQLSHSTELEEALDRAIGYAKELEGKNSQLLKNIDEQYDQRMDDMVSMIEGSNKSFDEEMGLWDKQNKNCFNKAIDDIKRSDEKNGWDI